MFHPTRVAALLLTLAAAACSKDASPTGTLDPSGEPSLQAAPVGLTTLTIGGTSSQLWPYTGTSFAGVPQDPLNLVFVSGSDPRNIRNALLSLDGNRSVAPFSESPVGMLLAGVAQGCTWSDAIGAHQVTYSDAGNWAGSIIQLECGSYIPFRFHLRLFDAGEWTVGNAHVDVLIPGTPDHEVISWEAGEAFVVMELARSGLLTAPPEPSPLINAAPTFGAIRPQIYNGLPAPLRLLTGGPAGTVTEPVPLGTDGRATVLNIAAAPPAEGSHESFTLMFGQFIPKPFCAGSNEFVRVDGPLQFRHDVRVDGAGKLHLQTVIEGDLQVRDFDPATGSLGELQEASVRDHYVGLLGGGVSFIQSTRSQTLSQVAGSQSLRERLRVSSNGRNHFDHVESCGN